MIRIRSSSERGDCDYGWLNTRHSFSFAQSHEPLWMGFRALRVINEDVIAPGGSFPMHPHRDIEIITYMLEGALAHKDNIGKRFNYSSRGWTAHERGDRGTPQRG